MIRKSISLAIVIGMVAVLCSPTPARADDKPAQKDEGVSWLSGFHLQRSFQQDDDSGAQFSLSKDIHDSAAKTVYATDFYLSWQQPLELDVPYFGNSENNNIVVSSEGHFSSDKKQSEDSWTFRAGGEFYKKYRQPDQHGLLGWYSTLNAKFEGDRDFETQVIALEGRVTPNFFDVGIGSELILIPDFAFFRWRPTVGIDLGRRLSTSDDVTDDDDSVVRLVLQADSRLRLFGDKYKLPLNIKSINLFETDKLFYLPLSEGRTNNLLTAGLEIMFSEDVAFQLAYTVGHDAPEFKKVEQIEAGISVKF